MNDPGPAGAPILDNPGLLKLELMRRGLRVPVEVQQALAGATPGATGHALFGSAGDLDLELPQSTWVTAPVLAGLMQQTPYRLERAPETAHGFAIASRDDPGRTPVRVQPRSHFFEHRTSMGLPFGRIGTVHGPYVALSPSNRCTFLHNADRCRFCGVGDETGTHRGVAVDDILEAVRVASGDHPVSMVYLSVGHLGTDDGGVRFLEPYVQAIKKHFDLHVAVDALPPRDDAWIDRTYAMGVDAVSYNLEIWDPDRFQTICPGPARIIGRERFLDALGYATTVFPSGGTICHLIVGLEPLESTRAGIDALTEAGVLPVLPVYRPFKGRDLRSDKAVERFEPSLEELAQLYGHLHAAVRERKLSLNLVRDISVVTTPLDARFFADGQGGFWTGLTERLLGSRLGRRTSARLSDLRRALRVRKVAAGGE